MIPDVNPTSASIAMQISIALLSQIAFAQDLIVIIFTVTVLRFTKELVCRIA